MKGIIKFGILGYAGSIGSRHGKNLMYLGHQTIGFDPAIKGRHTREEVIEQADAIIIATPTRDHFMDMMACKGKHILVEKPIVFDAPAAAIRGFCQAKASMGEVVAVGNNLRFHACVMEAKHLIKNNAIGTIGWADFWVNQKTTKELYLMDGVSRNWGAHEIDLALYLLGPGMPTEITKLGVVDDNDVEMEFSMKHDSGTFTTIHMDYLTEPEKRGFKLVGTHGVIEVDLVARTVKKSHKNSPPSIIPMADNWDSNYLAELKEFIHAVGQKGINRNSPLASGGEAAQVMDVILSVRSMAGLVDKDRE